MNKDLAAYLEDYWEFVLKHNPTFATYIGDHRYNDVLDDLSEEAIAGQAHYFTDLLAKAESIDEAPLSTDDTLNRRLFITTLGNHLRMYEFKTHFTPLDQMQGPHIDFPQLTEYHPFRTRNDIEDYISRLQAFPLQIDQVIENLMKGVARNATAFKKVIELTAGQVETFSRLDAETHPLYSPAQKISEGFSEHDIEEIRNTVKDSITTCVTPAYKKLHNYLRNEYLGHCRQHEGIWSLPDGNDLYRFFVRYHTTTDLSPGEIHDIGKSEVERISREIEKIMQQTGFSGSIREFADYVKKKRELYPESPVEILDGYRKVLSRMDEMLPDFFGRLPRAKYDIKAIESYREQSAPAAYYYPPPKDFSRPGYFYANTYKPEQRPRFFMEALSYHEAVPGHHLQIAIMQELEDLPDFRRYEGSTAFIEGWALYAEKLAGEMGFYQSKFSEYGRLTFEIWRAVRLVVDTGLHYYKWTREEAIRYCMEHSGEEEHEIEVEVDRYIAMPGQALAYKIGEMKIIDLKEKAKTQFGDDFDIREFHDRLLEHGALPMDALESIMNEWIVGKNSRQ